MPRRLPKLRSWPLGSLSSLDTYDPLGIFQQKPGTIETNTSVVVNLTPVMTPADHP